MKNGGYIEALRKTDKIEAVSESEAASLISRKKFLKKRSEVSIENDPTLRASRKIMDIMGEWEEIFNSYTQSRDVITASCDIANERKDVNMAGDIGAAWLHLRISLFQRKNALAEKKSIFHRHIWLSFRGKQEKNSGIYTVV